uniref:Uncharacterized protein n=1 Tax=Oryza meridionalis TaxID=40149 RepID=A0A0E0DNU3_9ORYZ
MFDACNISKVAAKGRGRAELDSFEEANCLKEVLSHSRQQIARSKDELRVSIERMRKEAEVKLSIFEDAKSAFDTAEMAGEARSEVERKRMAALAAGSRFIYAKRILQALERGGEVALSLIESLKHKATSVVAATTKSTFMGCAARGQQDDNDAGEDQKLDSGLLHTHATGPTHAVGPTDQQ